MRPQGPTNSLFFQRKEKLRCLAALGALATANALGSASCSKPTVIRDAGYDPARQGNGGNTYEPFFSLADPDIAGPCPEVTVRWQEAGEGAEEPGWGPSNGETAKPAELGLTDDGRLVGLRAGETSVLLIANLTETEDGGLSFILNKTLPLDDLSTSPSHIELLRGPTDTALIHILTTQIASNETVYTLWQEQEDRLKRLWSFSLPAEQVGGSFHLGDSDGRSLVGIWHAGQTSTLLRLDNSGNKQNLALAPESRPRTIHGVLADKGAILTSERSERGRERIWLHSLSAEEPELLFEGRLAQEGVALSQGRELALSILKDIDLAYNPIFADFAVGGVWQTSLDAVLQARPDEPVTIRWVRLSPLEAGALDYLQGSSSTAKPKLFGLLQDDLDPDKFGGSYANGVRSFLFGDHFRSEAELRPSCTSWFLRNFRLTSAGVFGQEADKGWLLVKRAADIEP